MRANIKSTCFMQVLFSTIKSSGFVKYAFGARIYFISPMDFTSGDSEMFHSYHLFAVNCPSSAAPKTHLYHEISVLEHILCRSHADSLLKKAAKMILI